jgi:uncharacterized protein YndB with AHSA1/START domain
VIRRQVVMPVTPERLWQALTDPEQIAGWFGGRLEWELEEGGRAWFHGDDGTERVGRVEAVRPGRHLRFRWWDERLAGAGATAGSWSTWDERLAGAWVGLAVRASEGARP